MKKQKLIVEISSAAVKMAVTEIGQGVKESFQSGFFSFTETERSKRKKEAVAFIKKFCTKEGVGAKTPTALCISLSDVLIKHISIPVMPDEESRAAIKWQIKQQKLFSETRYAYCFLKGTSIERIDGAKHTEITIFAVLKEIIYEHIGLLQEADCVIDDVYLEAIGLIQAYLNSSKRNDEESVAIIDIGYTMSHLIIMEGGHMRFSRQLAIGSHQITRALTGKLFSEQESFQLDIDEAEALKRKAGIPQGDLPIHGEKIKGHWVLSLMRPTLEHLAQEIKASIEYYEDDPIHNKAVKSVLLTGGGSQLKNLDQFLTSEVGIECTTFGDAAVDGEQRLTELEALFKTKSSLAHSFLPESFQWKKINKIQSSVLRIAMISLTAVLAISSLLINVQKGSFRTLLATTKKHHKTISEVSILNRKVHDRKNVVDYLAGQEIPTTHILKEISLILPEQLTLSRLLVSQEGKAVVLNGHFYPGEIAFEDVLNSFIQDNLLESPFFSDATMRSSEKMLGDAEGRYHFSVEVSLK